MGKCLLTLLASSDLLYLQLAYECAKNQQNTHIDYDVCIVINTLNDSFYQQVCDCPDFKDATIVRTESNGKPGKGHNSLLTYFEDHTEYDYLIPIDGDDFIYPFFLQRLQHYMVAPYSPDVLFIPFSDILTKDCNPSLHCPINNKCYLNVNIQEINLMNQFYQGKLSPFNYQLEHVNTPGRLVLFSRNALTMNARYQESFKWYDDLTFFMNVYEHAVLLPHKYNIYFIEEYYMYVYNRLNMGSATFEFLRKKQENYKKENDMLQLEIENKYLAIRDWDLQLIQVLKNPTKNEFLTQKIAFCENIVEKLNLPEIKVDKTHLPRFSAFFKQNNLPNIYKKMI